METTTFTPTGKQTRKQLAELIRTILGGVKPTYLGAPTMAYKVGSVEVGRHWRVAWPADLPAPDVEMIEALAAQEGYEVARDGEVEATPEGAASGEAGLRLAFPIDGWDEHTQGNVRAMLASKGHLIGKALGLHALPVEVAKGEISFPWFHQTPTPEVVDATTRLLGAMVKTASDAKRVSPKPPAGANEKYTMRCFLLRLGFIGEETKTARKVLMANLDGNAAWANPPATRADEALA